MVVDKTATDCHMTSFGVPHGFNQRHEQLPESVLILPELSSANVALDVRQNATQGLVVNKKREKSRKPLDPPIVVEMKVSKQADATQLFLHNPNLFARADLEYESGELVPNAPLAGCTASSIHRLKDGDINGSCGFDGGYFVFGELCVCQVGRFRVRITAYERREWVAILRCAIREIHDSLRLSDMVYKVASCQTTSFDVVNHKDYTGLEESSALTHAFVEQGVRLRIRKEQKPWGGARTRRDTKNTPGEDELVSLTDAKRLSSDNGRNQLLDGRASKRSKNSLGPVFPAVDNNTTDWGAFGRDDMQIWSRPESGQLPTFPATSGYPTSTRDYYGGRSSYAFSQNLPSTLPPVSHPLTSMGQSYEFTNAIPYQFQDLGQLSAQTSMSYSSGARPVSHQRNHSEQSSFSSSYDSRPSIELPQAFTDEDNNPTTQDTSGNTSTQSHPAGQERLRASL